MTKSKPNLFNRGAVIENRWYTAVNQPLQQLIGDTTPSFRITIILIFF